MSEVPDPQHCSICGAIFHGYGHNAQPVNNGRCCERCNREVVIPTRIAKAYAKKD